MAAARKQPGTTVSAKESPYSEGSKALEELKTALKAMPRKYLACRDLMHAWKVLNNYHHHVQHTVGASTVFIARDLVCIRCEGQKKQLFIVNKNGELESYGTPRYSYQPGYQIPKTARGNKPSKVVRQIEFEKVMEEALQQDGPDLRLIHGDAE